MRISIPTIPHDLLYATPSWDSVAIAAAVQRVTAFLAGGRTTLVTGAGVSVDSGIRAYRGHDGRYMNPNYKLV